MLNLTYISDILSKPETLVKNIGSCSTTVQFSVFWRFCGISRDWEIVPTGELNGSCGKARLKTSPAKRDIGILFTRIELPEIWTVTCGSGETIPIIGIDGVSGLTTTSEPCHECGIGATAFNFVDSSGV